jgi:non-ribosomal peptide synthetase-like protein
LYRSGRLYEAFEQAARRWPDAVAVDVPPAEGRPARRLVSYGELSDRSDGLARAIRAAAGIPSVAAILLPRTSEHVYLAQLAVLKLASAYVCIDPAFPDGQLAEILRDSGAGIVVTDRNGADRVRRNGYTRTVLRTDQPVPASRGPLPAPPSPENLAYLIYTSGTTGRPKGIMIAHHSIASLVRSDIIEFGLGPGDRVAQGSSAAYDSSVEEVWMALSSGATLVVLDDTTARLGPDLVAWLRAERITVLCPPPTLLRTTGCADPERELPDLRLLYVGGEALPDDVAERWGRGRRLVNGYGPTECTVTCLRDEVLPGGPVTIGRPVPGLRAWALDERLNPVPDGRPGELCLGGTGLAVGYLGLPELNARKFPVHRRLGRIYRTGDLVHREADGRFHYHGRIDSQVKLRGYRIELEAIESCLARCRGVREAGCRVQGEGASEALVAYIVPADPLVPPAVETLKEHLRAHLPAYMVPSMFGTLDELPRSAGGKLRRSDLPALAGSHRDRPTPAPEPRTPVEERIARFVRDVLQLTDLPPSGDDFFTDLGGSSLQAAMLVSALRGDPVTASLTVRDVYEARTVASLARRTASATPPAEAVQEPRPEGNPAAVTLAQAAWLLGELLVAAPIAYLVVFRLLPWLLARIGLIPLILLAVPSLSLVAPLFTLASIGAAIVVKKIVIGRYTPVRVSVWSGLFVRMWIVRGVAQLVPWRLIAGTELQCMALRALGARIGKRVHIHRGVDLHQGGWDLLEIGDDVTISQDAALHLVRLEAGQVVVGPITVADGATLDIRAGMGPHTRIDRNAWLSTLASLPEGEAIGEGERWDGIPARPVGRAPEPPAVTVPSRTWSPRAHATVMILTQSLLVAAMGIPGTLLTIGFVLWFDLDYDGLLAVLDDPRAHLPLLASAAVLPCLALPFGVASQALAARALGPVSEGVIDRWSPGYIRVWTKGWLVDAAGRWLSGGLFWPLWLRWAGMSVGRGCEISTIIDVVPELVHIGPGTFFADGVYLGGPRLHRNTVSLAAVHLGSNTFLGNHVVVAAGQRLPDDVLLGICTVADDRVVTAGSSWFGHPPFVLPRREIVESDRAVTHEPSLVRVVSRLFWEWLRFALPVVPMLVLMAGIYALFTAGTVLPLWAMLAVAAPAAALASAGLLCLVVLGLKWGLLGRVRPGRHPLWSCWCSRWDFLYVAWGMIAAPVLALLEETLLLPVYLRLMGMKIGRRVVLGGGFSQVVDPDMIDIGDRATVNAMFQAHTFEDRVLKIGAIRVGAWSTLGDATVPLYGADIGPGAVVAPHSVVMKHEHLEPGRRYEGAPTRRQEGAGRGRALSPVRRPTKAQPAPWPTGRHARRVAEPVAFATSS